MKKTTSLILALTLALIWGIATHVSAQAGYSVNDQISKFKEELKLDQDQSRKVALLLIKMDEQKTADEEKYADNPEKLRSAAMERRSWAEICSPVSVRAAMSWTAGKPSSPNLQVRISPRCTRISA